MFYVTPGGQIMLEMVDYYGGTVLILSLASVEVIAINWIYGTSTLTRDFNFMLNTQLSVYWRFCWGVLCPVLLPLLFLYVLFTQAGIPNIPLGAQIAGWLVAAIGKKNGGEIPPNPLKEAYFPKTFQKRLSRDFWVIFRV